MGKSTEIQQTNESFNKSEIKTTEVGDGDRKWKPHVLRGKNPWKGTGGGPVREELVEQQH